MRKEQKLTLAQFVSQKREARGFTQSAFAKKCNLSLSDVESIEAGIDLFLSTTVRQKLAKGLRVSLTDIKKHEHRENFELVSNKLIEELKDRILLGENELLCPLCGEKLITRIAKMYDLEDNLMLHPKARCSKCPFQIK